MGVIFWENRKLFEKGERGVRIALKHPMLLGKPIIGRGAYSIILGNETSVLKLTIDRVAYALAEYQSQWQCPAFPDIRGLHGIIGALDIGVPLFLIEMEPLEKFVVGTPSRKRCLSIARQLRIHFKEGETPSERLRYVSKLQPEDEMARALGLLANFLESRWPAAELDLHAANFMLRPDTGEAVITDPFMDMDTRRIVLENFKLGLPEGTVIL